jgi:Glycosyl hydrolase catalytic core
MRGRVRQIGSLAALTVAVFACAAGSAPAGKFHGVVPQGHLTDADYSRMRSGKVGTLRVNVRWSTVQPSKGTPRAAWNWAPYDEIFANAAQRGVRVLPALDAPSPKGIPDPPVNKSGRRAFVDFAGAVAARYGRRGSFWSGRRARPAKAFQIYNEQNGPAYWRARPNARKYGKLLRGASQAIRRKDRRAEIVLGGMFSTPSGRGAINSWRYLDKLYKVKKIERAFDTVAAHPYSESLRGIKYQIRKLRSSMKRNGDRKADLRITEFGWGSARRGNLNKGRKGQARMLTKAFRLFENKKRSWNLRGANWFSFQDNPDGACSFCPTAGLFKANGQAKPSWGAFKRAARRS